MIEQAREHRSISKKRDADMMIDIIQTARDQIFDVLTLRSNFFILVVVVISTQARTNFLLEPREKLLRKNFTKKYPANIDMLKPKINSEDEEEKLQI